MIRTSSILALAVCGFVPTRALADAGGNGNSEGSATTVPTTPIGGLTAYPTVVQTGTKPTLTWSIAYPSKVSDIAVINPPGEIVFTDPSSNGNGNGPMFICVQMVNVGVTSSDPTAITSPVDVRMKMNAGNYFQLFYGTKGDIDPTRLLYVKNLNACCRIDFGGSYVKSGNCTPFYSSLSTNRQVIALVNGQSPPTTIPLDQNSNLQSAIKPYLDASGKVSLGPLCVLIMMELGTTDFTTSAFDYQDVVLLVSFNSKHPNNGNHNDTRLDGVSSFNPGSGNGGPKGTITITAGVDDRVSP